MPLAGFEGEDFAGKLASEQTRYRLLVSLSIVTLQQTAVAQFGRAVGGEFFQTVPRGGFGLEIDMGERKVCRSLITRTASVVELA
jgi:hypothetical protein